MKEVQPEFFFKLAELEAELRSGYAYAYFNGQPFYLRDLLDNNERQALLNRRHISQACVATGEQPS